MIDIMPHQKALLPRTKLRWVDLQALLNDGKIARASRLPTVLCLHLGEQTDVIMLRDGDPVTAARVESGGRRVVRVDSVVRFAERERERAEVAFYQVSEGQQRAMWATLDPEVEAGEPIAAARLADSARASGGDGVAEIQAGGVFHYVVFEGGAPVQVFGVGLADGADPAAGLETLARRHGAAPVRLFGPPRDPPPQAPAALFSLYERLVQRLGHEVAGAIGTEATTECFTAARGRLEETSPVLASFAVHRDGRVVADDAVVTRAELTDAVAAWIRAILKGATDRGLPDTLEVAGRAIEPDRHALAAQGMVASLLGD
jgi:hypothetical protein